MEIQVNVALWVVQVFLALAFFGAGFDQPLDQPVTTQRETASLAARRFQVQGGSGTRHSLR